MLPLKNAGIPFVSVCIILLHALPLIWHARGPGAVVWHATAGKLGVAPYQEDAVFYFYEWKLFFL